jgi:hypothetical protein
MQVEEDVLDTSYSGELGRLVLRPHAPVEKMPLPVVRHAPAGLLFHIIQLVGALREPFLVFGPVLFGCFETSPGPAINAAGDRSIFGLGKGT